MLHPVKTKISLSIYHDFIKFPYFSLYLLYRLRPNSLYVFRVAATNDRGKSPYSVQSDPVTTLEDSKY